MSISITTLTTAITSVGQLSCSLASVTGISSPNFQTGSGITWLLIDQEFMLVTAVNTTTLVVTVLRGQNGTSAQTHSNSANVTIGQPSDFGQYSDLFAQQVQVNTEVSESMNWLG